MPAPDGRVSEHYSTGDLGNQLLDALRAAGKDPDALTIDDLAPVDEFHIRGRAATEELAQWAEVQPTRSVLDVGCGLGGTSRYLAATRGCHVSGVDLTREYCQVAEMLSARVGLAERTEFHQGSALALPFADRRFDVVWTEHVQMNIADKVAFYGELARVLKPAGRLAFHDIFAGGNGEGAALHLPVPWAADASINHLCSVDELRGILSELRLSPVRWEDKTEESAAFFRTVLQRVRSEGWAPVGLHLLVGKDAAGAFENLLRNLEEDRVRVVQAVVAPGGQVSARPPAGE